MARDQVHDRVGLPIVYVRGFAGTDFEGAVQDPFYGFNEGSVHVRVGDSPRPTFFQFESPLLRLMIDEGYELVVRGDQRTVLKTAADGSLAPRSIWVHRFYDTSAESLAGLPRDFELEEAAKALFELVQEIRAKTGAPRVHLVAHSMGGLVCRSMIQRVIPEATGDPKGAEAYVESLFTYGTPHGGIEFDLGLGLFEKARDLLNLKGADIFGPRRMYEYLTPRLGGDLPQRPDGWDAREMPADGFDVDRVFCLVGTNAENYDVARGLSAKAVGPRSDGLVQIDNAYVQDAHRSFVHRSHSGRYGLVNSEEGYQNLRRFLFADLRVDVELVDVEVQGSREDTIVWQLESRLSIRGLPIVMHEQRAAHHCPIQLEWKPKEDSSATPVPLLTTFLMSSQRTVRPGAQVADSHLRQALGLRILSLRQDDGFFVWDDHLEQVGDFADTLIVDIEPGGEGGMPRGWAAWNSGISGSLRDWQPGDEHELRDAAPDVPLLWRGVIPMPDQAKPILGPDAKLCLTVRPRRG